MVHNQNNRGNNKEKRGESEIDIHYPMTFEDKFHFFIRTESIPKTDEIESMNIERHSEVVII